MRPFNKKGVLTKKELKNEIYLLVYKSCNYKYEYIK